MNIGEPSFWLGVKPPYCYAAHIMNTFLYTAIKPCDAVKKVSLYVVLMLHLNNRGNTVI